MTTGKPGGNMKALVSTSLWTYVPPSLPLVISSVMILAGHAIPEDLLFFLTRL